MSSISAFVDNFANPNCRTAEVARKAAKYRREIIRWYTAGKKGPQPSLAPGLLEGTKRLAEVVYELDAG